MANYKKWSDTEKSFIRDNAPSMGDKEIALKLSVITGQNISADMIRQQRRKLLLIKKIGRPKKLDWKDAELQS
jgi:hypothetical protein